MLYTFDLHMLHVNSIPIKLRGENNLKKKKKKKKAAGSVFREKREKIPNCLAVACYMVAKSPL